MSELVLQNCKLYFDGYDLSGSHNNIELVYGAEMKDITVFGNESKRRLAGLKDVEVKHSGFVETGDGNVDDVLFDNLGADKIMTVCPTTGAAGEVAYFMQSVSAEYAPGAAIGDVMGFSGAAYGRGNLIRGQVLDTGEKTSTGTSTAQQVGAVTSSQYLYAALHVLSVSGTDPTLDVVVQSDDASGMASPTDRITFSQATAVGAQWGTRVAGAITDDYWRISYTIGGSDTPTFSFIVSIGIL